jgi:hypothetical protein
MASTIQGAFVEGSRDGNEQNDMRRWEERPIEVANLLNPAFCGRVIYQSIGGYRQAPSTDMPYALLFLVLPLVLHAPTRATINGTTRHFQVWLNTHQEVKLGLAARARSLVPYTREAVSFLCAVGATKVIGRSGSLGIAGKLRARSRATFPVSDETRECIAKARIVGRWFAKANSPATVYALCGLMP